MILRKIACERNFDLGPKCWENGAQSGHCRPKMRFFAVAMATDEPIGLKLKRALCWPGIDHATKFGRDRPSGICSRADRNIHTDRQVGWLRCVTGLPNGNHSILRKSHNICQRLGIGLSVQFRINFLGRIPTLSRPSKYSQFFVILVDFWLKISVFRLWQPNYQRQRHGVT